MIFVIVVQRPFKFTMKAKELKARCFIYKEQEKIKYLYLHKRKMYLLDNHDLSSEKS